MYMTHHRMKHIKAERERERERDSFRQRISVSG
jgi:hypothetical protein